MVNIEDKTQLNFFRYKNKRYNFKVPIELTVTEIPDPDMADEEYDFDRGEFEVVAEEWSIRGSDYRSVEGAVIDAEYYFHLDYGWLIDSDIEIVTPDQLHNKLGFEYYELNTRKLRAVEKEIIKKRREAKNELLNMIGTIDDDVSMPWTDEKD